MRYFLLLIICLIGCQPDESLQIITNRTDYQNFLNPVSFDFSNHKKINDFWSKRIKQEPRVAIFYQKLAAYRADRFDETGDVRLLTEIDSLLNIANPRLSQKQQVGNLLRLSANAIKLHNFKGAANYAQRANQLTEKKFGPLMMTYDAYMELGFYETAGRIIHENKRLDSFDYLIRLSKYQDHKGNLDSAIVVMESALSLVKSGSRQKKLWAKTNLGDMYGHAGRLEESYDSYLAVLTEEPKHYHALKGIAWLAFSNDKKSKDATNLFRFLENKTELPDNLLLLAEVAEYSHKTKEMKQYRNAFLYEATKSKYDGMYNKYIIEILAKNPEKMDEAITLAQNEVLNRATPSTYAQLAWCHSQKGNHAKAIELIEEYVINKTFEPEPIYLAGIAYYKNGDMEKATPYLKEALNSSFELGPLVEQELTQLLKRES